MTVVFQSKFLLLQLKAPMDPSYAWNILNIKVRAWSCIIEVYLKAKDLTYHNWSSLIGDEPSSICPLYPSGVNLPLKIPWEEEERDRLPVTAGMQEAKIPSSAACLDGKKRNCCSVSFWNVVTPHCWKKGTVYGISIGLILWETLSWR